MFLLDRNVFNAWRWNAALVSHVHETFNLDLKWSQTITAGLGKKKKDSSVHCKVFLSNSILIQKILNLIIAVVMKPISCGDIVGAAVVWFVLFGSCTRPKTMVFFLKNNEMVKYILGSVCSKPAQIVHTLLFNSYQKVL